MRGDKRRRKQKSMACTSWPRMYLRQVKRKPYKSANKVGNKAKHKREIDVLELPVSAEKLTRIWGRVFNEQDLPLCGVYVVLLEEQENGGFKYKDKTLTDSYGAYYFYVKRSKATYKIVVSA